ncbi:hypothetical protein F5884DRAFT_771907 [Xylogone sp. PMI_703]|nr:hypothetical protein F5884DRAFT_771907 [Xylogone sp. PMI_703]
MAPPDDDHLSPPARTSIDDPGAHSLESSDEEEHFSDAQSGLENPSPKTPAIITTDEKPASDIAPETEEIKVEDRSTVAPEEVEESHSTAAKNQLPESASADLPTPEKQLEEQNTPSQTETPGAPTSESNDITTESDIARNGDDNLGSPTNPGEGSNISHARRKSSGARQQPASELAPYDEAEDGAENEGFGDDFDDFEEGDEDAEFGDFDDGFQEPEPAPQQSQSVPGALSLPVLNFDELDSLSDIQAATEPYLDALFPPDTIDTSVLPPLSKESPVFFTDRSASLWSQLVAPPPLQPPNWIRSRIRRLFLVSLGVPVDLDEILPASKQKKLILPSIDLNPQSGSPHDSTDPQSIARLKQSEANNSTTSVDSQGKPSKRRKGPPPEPQLDLVSARQLCLITDEALNGLTGGELKEHVKKLEEMEVTAKEVLDYWTKRTDEKLGEREAFEGVVENLVKHARKVRK